MRVLLIAALLALAASAEATGKRINWHCVDRCYKYRGWQPVCVGDGTGWMSGSIYPNLCTLYNCITPEVSPKAPKYDVDWSANRCKRQWLNHVGNPTTSDTCACDIWDKPDPWWPRPQPPKPRVCIEGRNGCQHCHTATYCSKCFFGFRRIGGICRPCNAGEGCLRCPASVHICTYCCWPFMLDKATGKCVWWGKKDACPANEAPDCKSM